MKNKYVCPKCNSQLKVYKEYLFKRECNINVNTGKLNKKKTSTKPVPAETPIGLACTKCDFIYYEFYCVSNKSTEKEYEYLNQLFKNIYVDDSL